MGLTQYLKQSAARHGGRAALVFEGRRRTWMEFADRVARLAAVFQKLDVEEGDRVAMLANSSDRYVEYYYGVLWAGGVVMPLNSRHALPEMLAQVGDANPKVLLVDASFVPMAEAIRKASPTVKQIIYADDREVPAGMIGYEQAISAASPCDDACNEGDQLACLFYTGGTTGRAKGVMLTHDNLLSSAFASIKLIGLDEALIHLHAGPLFHLAAGARVLATTIVGGRHVVISKFAPRDVLTAIEAERITAITLVPTMLGMVLQEPEFATFDRTSLRLISYGASPMPEALLREAMARFPGVRFSQAYGMTELSPAATVLLPEDHRLDGPVHRLRSAGRPVPGVEVRIFDADDRTLPAGAVGEIAVRGPNVMKGYWRQPEQTRQALRGGWMHTGDAGYFDADGYLYVVDRTKDMIVSGGENVYSAEVENAIAQHPAVGQCAVIGIPHDKWGEAVHAVIVPREGRAVDADDIVAHCRSLIAGYKCPRTVEVRSDTLPLSAVKKIDKVALRAPYWKGRARQVN